MSNYSEGRNLSFKAGDDRKLLPEGDYVVVLERIAPTSFMGKRSVLDFTFNIAEGPHKGIRVKAFLNSHYEKFSSFTKFYQWWCVAAGRPPEEGEDLTTEVFFDSIFTARIKTKISRKTKYHFSNVTELIAKTGRF